eukprot:g4735.t1
MSYNTPDQKDWEEELDPLDEDYVESLVDRLPQPLTVDDFEWKYKLVKGSYGEVSLCVHQALGKAEPLAIKVVEKRRVWEDKQVTQVLTEKMLCYTLQHPFIVKFGGCFQDPKRLYFITEYCAGGDFFFHLRRLTCLRRGPAMFYTASLVTVLEYLHNEFGVIYRDLKPENILLDRDGYIKLTDFGLAKRIAYKTYTFCGTPEYIAPEIIKMTGHSFGVDWWSLGVCLYEMLVGQPPFVSENPMNVFKLVLQGKLRFPALVTSESKDFCKRLLRVKPGRRLGCSSKGSIKVREHDFFKGLKWDKLMAKQLGQKEGAIVPKVAHAMDSSAYLDKAQRKAQELIALEKERKKKAGGKGMTKDGKEEKEESDSEELEEDEWEEGVAPWGDEFDPFENF